MKATQGTSETETGHYPEGSGFRGSGVCTLLVGLIRYRKART